MHTRELAQYILYKIDTHNTKLKCLLLSLNKTISHKIVLNPVNVFVKYLSQKQNIETNKIVLRLFPQFSFFFYSMMQVSENMGPAISEQYLAHPGPQVFSFVC